MGCNSSKQQEKRGGKPTVPPKKPGDAPRDAICHICGRKYTIHSINIHVPQCEKLFEQRQANLPVKERKPLPVLPKRAAKMDLKARNELAMEIYNDTALEACKYCGRTFLPDRLEVHLRSCAKNHGETYPPPTKAAYPVPTGATQAHNTVICHVCGRKYTTHSIDIHLPQCEKLFLERQSKLPKAKRKELPVLPAKAKKMTLDERNELATKIYNERALFPCKYCGRTFLEDRLAVHIKSCERNHLKAQDQTKKKKKKLNRKKSRQYTPRGGIAKD